MRQPLAGTLFSLTRCVTRTLSPLARCDIPPLVLCILLQGAAVVFRAKFWSFEALLEGGWGGGSSLSSRWGGIWFPNLWGRSLRPLFLILNLLYPFILINWTLSPLWREEGLWYSYAVEFLGDPYHPLGGLLSCFGGLDWIVGGKIAMSRLGCDLPSLCNSMYLLDYSNTNLFP